MRPTSAGSLQVECEQLSYHEAGEERAGTQPLLVQVPERSRELAGDDVVGVELLAIPEERDLHHDVVLVVEHHERVPRRVVDDDGVAKRLRVLVREVSHIGAGLGLVDRDEEQRAHPDDGVVCGDHHHSFQTKRG